MPDRLSVWFNAPDGQWNWGEGFRLNAPHADSGGVHGASPSTPKVGDAIVTTPSPTFGRWGPPNNPVPGVLMTTGYFWPANVAQPRNEAAFSLWAPSSLVQGGADDRPIVLVVLVHETLSGKPAPGYTKPWPYPGSSLALGLIPPNIHLTPAQSIADGASDWDRGYHLMIGYAMMPTSARPYPMTLQRAIDLVGFAKDVVEVEFPDDRTIQAVLIAGGSHGAGIAMLAPTMYPELFHAGVGFAHPPDFAQALPMQEFHRWVCSHMGTHGEGAASIYDVLGIGFFGKHANARGQALSVPARFRAQANAGGPAAYLQRPLYLVIGDEDPTDTGEDWLGLLGVSALAEAGSIPVSNAHASVKFHYSRMDKLCHESLFRNGSLDGTYWLPDQSPGQPGQTARQETWDAIAWMIPQALAASAVPAQIPVPAPPAGQANLDPFRGIYREHLPASWPASGSSTPLAFASNQPGYPIVGWSGIAIADVVPTSGSNEFQGNELVVTSLDGYLLVFGVSGSNGNYSLSLLYKKGFVGALGAHNSIHVGDYAVNGTLQAGSDGKKEVYVAGSFGLRRFDVQ